MAGSVRYDGKSVHRAVTDALLLSTEATDEDVASVLQIPASLYTEIRQGHASLATLEALGRASGLRLVVDAEEAWFQVPTDWRMRLQEGGCMGNRPRTIQDLERELQRKVAAEAEALRQAASLGNTAEVRARMEQFHALTEAIRRIRQGEAAIVVPREDLRDARWRAFWTSENAPPPPVDEGPLVVLRRQLEQWTNRFDEIPLVVVSQGVP